jgi:hypothetical protein
MAVADTRFPSRCGGVRGSGNHVREVLLRKAVSDGVESGMTGWLAHRTHLR